MKIVNKQEFYKLPAGTLFSFYEPCIFTGINIKGKTIQDMEKPIDFFYKSLIGNVSANHTGEFLDILSTANENKNEFKLDFITSSRDGIFDEESLYAIYNTNEI